MVVLAQVLRLLARVIAIVDFDFEALVLLEVEVDGDFLDPGWAQVVMDGLRLA